MNQGTRFRSTHAAMVAAVVLIIAACSSGSSSSSSSSSGTAQSNVKCTTDSVTQACLCEVGTDRQLSTTVTQVSGCDAAPAGLAWECCHDRDTSSSYTTKCECAVWRCVRHADAGSCDCSFFAEESSGNTVTESCTGAVCVKSEDQCSCSDDPKTQFGYGESVDSCVNAKPSTFCRSLPFSKSSCAGLTWKPPDTPRPAGDCIRNGNACGPAKQANGNCCSGYCGENGTCEMK